MMIEAQPLVVVTQHAIRILSKELGIVNTIRFLNQFSAGYGNYTEERATLFDDLSVDDIVAQIKRAHTNEIPRIQPPSSIDE